MRVSVTVSIDAEGREREIRVDLHSEGVSESSLETVAKGVASEAAVRAARAMNLPPSENPGLKGQVRM